MAKIETAMDLVSSLLTFTQLNTIASEITETADYCEEFEKKITCD